MSQAHSSSTVLYNPLLRPDAVAQRLGISRTELAWLRSQPGRAGLRAVKLGTIVCYRSSDVLRLAAPNSAGTESLVPPAQPHTGGLLRVDDAAKYLSIPAATLYHWRSARRGFGPRAVKFGGSVRYRVADLNLWIEQHIEEPYRR